MFSFIRKGRPSFFNRFISLILVLILFIFLNCNFSKKEVKAIEPVTTFTFATYLLVGGLATMCGVKFASMPKESRYDFISGGFEAIKDVANWGVDGQGLATKLILNEATIKAFLDYVQSKENTSIMLGVTNYTANNETITITFPAPNTLSNSNYSTSRLVGSISGTFTLNTFCYYPVNYNGTLYIYTITNCSGMSSSGYNGFYLCNSSDFRMIYDPYAHYDMIDDSWYTVNCTNCFTTGKTFTVSATGDFTASVGDLNKTVVYPKNLTDVRGIEDYTKQWDKTNVGQQSIEVDGAKTGVDISAPIEGSNSLTDDIVFPAGIEEGVEVPGLKINTGEGSIESAPDVTKDETLEHKGILQDILDWLGSLVLDLMDFLLNLLDKLIDMLKSLLISLFVPSVSLAETKELIMERLSLPIFSAPTENFLNKEPFTFIFNLGSYNDIDDTEIVVTLDQPWFSIIRELILGYVCYLAVLFAYKKISSLHGSD